MRVALYDIRMYSEFVGVFAFILVGTIAYVRYMATAWLTPFVILAAAVVLGLLSLLKMLQRAVRTKKDDGEIQEDFDALMAGCIWLAWITYGVLFGNVDHVIIGAWAYAHGAVVVTLVVLTHVDLGPSYIWGIVSSLALLLFLPHPGMVSQSIDPLVLFPKILLFYIIYILVEVSQKVEFAQQALPPSDENRVLSALVKAVQTVWILLSVWELTPFALLQALILSRRIYIAYRSDTTTSHSELPTHTTHEHDLGETERAHSVVADSPPLYPEAAPSPPQQLAQPVAIADVRLNLGAILARRPRT